MSNKKRDSRFELIRIISMIFIIMYHYTIYGNWTSMSINTMKIQAFKPWGQVGVGLFVMITGYFISTHEFNFQEIKQRCKNIWIKTLFYSWIILFLTLIFSFRAFGLKDYIFAIFPVIFDEYWFISSYIVLIFLSPLLNWMIKNGDKRIYLIYIMVVVVVTDVMPYIKNNNTPNTPLGNMFSVGSMLAPYLIAAYIRKYNIKISKLKSWLIILIGLFLEYFSMFVLTKHPTSKDIGHFTFGLLPLIVSVGFFMLFLNVKKFNSKIVNIIASGVLASYLITEHPLFRIYFWHHLLNVRRFQNPTWIFIFMGIFIAVISVLVCSIIDLFYQLIIRKIVK